MLNGELQSRYICPFSPLLLRSYFTHSACKHCVSEWKDIRSEAQLILSSPQSETTAQISARRAEISQWISARQLKLNLDETEQLSLPGTVCPIRDLSINIENTAVSLA